MSILLALQSIEDDAGPHTGLLARRLWVAASSLVLAACAASPAGWQDEVVSPTAFVVEEDAPPVRPRLGYTVRVPTPDDDFAPAVGLLGGDDRPAAVAPAVSRTFPTLQEQDDPAGFLRGTDDDDGTVAPVPQTSTRYLSLPLLDPEEPAGSLFGVPDGDGDLPALSWPRLPLPSAWFTAGHQDEPGSLGLDDDGMLPVGPLPAPRYVALPILEPDDPAGALFGCPDEDMPWLSPLPLWSTPVARVAFLGAQEDLPALGSGDEGDRPVGAPWPQGGLPPGLLALSQQDELPATPATVDDDASVPVRGWPTPRVVVPSVDDDLPALGIDDDALLWVAPTAVIYRSLPSLDQDEPAGSLFGRTEDEGAPWVRVWPLTPTPAPLLSAAWQDEVPPTAATVVDEDGPLPLTPAPSPRYSSLPVLDPEEPAGSLFGRNDEEAQPLLRLPAWPTLASRVVFLPAGDELPVLGIDDEGTVAPVPWPTPRVVRPVLETDEIATTTPVEEDAALSSYRWSTGRIPLPPSDTDEPAGSLFGTAEDEAPIVSGPWATRPWSGLSLLPSDDPLPALSVEEESSGSLVPWAFPRRVILPGESDDPTVVVTAVPGDDEGSFPLLGWTRQPSVVGAPLSAQDEIAVPQLRRVIHLLVSALAQAEFAESTLAGATLADIHLEAAPVIDQAALGGSTLTEITLTSPTLPDGALP